jgi:TldD protein
MKRRDFIHLAGMGAGAMMIPLPSIAHHIHPEDLLKPGMDILQKKQLADTGLNVAKSGGATYADVRIGRYLNQFVITRENKVQSVINTESFGAGVRVIVNGTWGFASSNDMTTDGLKKTAERAVAIAKANSKFQKEPLKLAPVQPYAR